MDERKLKPIIYFLIAFILALLAYRAGVFVGERKAMYSYRWSENYQKNFGGPNSEGFIDAHGISGIVLHVDQSGLVIQDKDNTEKTVIVSRETSIHQGHNDIGLNALSPSMHVVVIGEPDDEGHIQARLIRVFPMGSPDMPSGDFAPPVPYFFVH